MPEIKILETKMSAPELKELAKSWHGILIKGSADIEKERVAIGGDYHIESCEVLTNSGSRFESVWGFNIRFDRGDAPVLEFDSMINLKPNQGNRAQQITDESIIQSATNVVKKFVALE